MASNDTSYKSGKMPQNSAQALPVYDANGTYASETQNMLPTNTMHYDNDDFGMAWNSGICGCCTCNQPWVSFLACLCPCLLFGEIHHALHNSGVAGDTSNRSSMPNVRCNAAACEFCLLDCPLSMAVGLVCTYVVGCAISIPSMSCCTHNMTRRQIRHNNAAGPIAGTCLSDVLCTFCCSCCVLVQEYQQLFPHV